MRLMLPIDTWERHTIVAALAGAPATVLDVGGRPGELEAFLPGARITTLNVDEPADVVLEGGALPFADDSFDLVTSIDVLEHLPPHERRGHLEELIRVARERVVACCPLGTAEHVQAERELADWYASVTARRHRFLEEHLTRGLPTEAELREIVSGLPFELELKFHGDFRATNRLFATGVLARRSPRDLLRYARSRFLRRPDTRLSAAGETYTNRVFLAGRTTSAQT